MKFKSSCNLLLICLSNLKVWQKKIDFHSLINLLSGKMVLLHFTAARVIPSAARVIPSAAALIPSSMIWDWLIVAAPTAIRTRAGWLNTVWGKNRSDQIWKNDTPLALTWTPPATTSLPRWAPGTKSIKVAFSTPKPAATRSLGLPDLPNGKESMSHGCSVYML